MTQNYSNNGAVPSPRQVRQYDETFKRDAVRLLEQSGRPRAQVARDLGVSDVSLSTWQARYGCAGTGAGAEEGPGGMVAMLAENARLKAELEHMTRQRNILKKPWPSSARSRREV